VGAPQNQEIKLKIYPKEKVMNSIKRFLADEGGMETLEYAVIAGLIAIAAAIIYASTGTWATTIQNRLGYAAAQS
jgi:Flp pilus assembly pilin Flp